MDMGGNILSMAKLQTERELYAAMFGEDSIIQTDQTEVTLNDYDEAIFLYEDMLHRTLIYHPNDHEEIAFLKKHIQECKVAKRELYKSLNNEQRRSLAA